MGVRRVGKTELIRSWLKSTSTPHLLLNGEDTSTITVLAERSVENYKRLLGDCRLLVIDEAQHISDIGRILKLMIDEIPGLSIVATGSSVFDLENELGEPLTGRSNSVTLFPLAQIEYGRDENLIDTAGKLEERLILGNYPELQHYTSWEEKENYLRELVNSYLIRDILAFERLKRPDIIISLLRLVAFQIGHEVSIHELGQQLGVGKNTVDRYLDLLTKVFVLHRVKAFSKNQRKEISKSSRWYFLDNGIRNALIANTNPLALRNDLGALWENYLVTERLKYQSYNQMLVNNYFWRTYNQQEIDWVEERGGNIHGYEFKWNGNKSRGAPSAWRNFYPEASFDTVHQHNYLYFIT